MKATQRNRAGFTLLEVMVAVSILAISLTALFGAQSSGVSLAMETRFNTHAPLLAQLKLAELTVEGDPFSQEGDFGEEFSGFNWELTVEDALFDQSELLQNIENLQHLTLTVTWGEGEYSYRVDSYQRGGDEEQ